MAEPYTSWREGGFGLYVHWPFCEAKCPYCDFNSHVTAHVDQSRWAEALVSELHRYGALTEGRKLDSIYFGGGTPSLMAPDTVRAVIDASRAHWAWSNDIEITLEANPRSVEISKFEGFAHAGVNRVSLGVQALRPDDLRRLGRLHGVDDALKALDVARSCFDRVSFDLIYGRQGQSLPEWETELNEALDLAGDHLSLYQLTVEQGTAFWDRAQAGKLRGLPDEDLGADMYEATAEIAAAKGFSAYEVSNYALPDAMSRHNLVYWRSGDYVGIGPGAHGRVTMNGTRHATVARKMPGDWIRAAETGSADAELEPLPRADVWNEFLLMGLRLTEGVSMTRARKIGGTWADALPLAYYQDLGLIWREDDRFGATPQGRLVLNTLTSELLSV
ncbi:coproporphyrinogen III oxidase [Salipiger pallidus]|uniref:Heme chaperone HemW n=1 Tax=Salipiger pallidus TaxID=1775170 RepID=A0A8J2ZLA6_9RHOB|nr:radical SAM family heme chaperone HemW [Salipiger pallidus]GGG78935.1 coproporphyrinogen III oxidase [Salipiger pallidus]